MNIQKIHEILSGFKERLERLGNHKYLAKAVEYADQFAVVVANKKYQGSNPAVASVYSQFRSALIVISIITAVVIIFGAFVPIDSAAIARGNIVVISKRKTVQHLEGGVIKNILVEEGQTVKQGQPLVEINDVAPKANKEIIESQLWTLKVAEARALALQNKDGNFVVPEDIVKAADKNEELQQAIKSQTELFNSQYKLQQGKIETTKQHMKSAEEEIIGLQAKIDSSDSQLALINEEISNVETLLKKGYATKIRYHDLLRTAAELKGNAAQYKAEIAKAKQGITENEMDIANLENDFANKIAEELHDITSKIKDNEEKLGAATDVMRRTIITSPSEGVVTGLKFHTVGGVIAAGTPIMDITPQSDQLIVEAKVQPTDIDVVEVGMDARIVFTAYKSRRMPLLKGKVIQVSADVFNEQQGGQNISYYTARIEVDSKEIDALDSKIKLYPGMPVDAFIRTGSRSFFSYMLSPITDSLQKAFKED